MANSRRRLAQEGLPIDRHEQALTSLRSLLANNGPMTTDEIARGLQTRRINVEGQARLHLVWLAAAGGTICRIPSTQGKVAYVLARDWIGASTGLGREDALKELATRYLRSHGPATPQDMSKWTGMSLSEVNRAWSLIAHRIDEVAVGPARLWMLKSKRADPPEHEVRLIPAFDELLLGWIDRSPILEVRNEKAIYPGGGMFRPAVIVDGRAAGVWSKKRLADGWAVVVRPFARIDAQTRAKLAAESDDIGRWLGTKSELILGDA